MVGSSSSLMNNINTNRASFNRASINNLKVNNLTLKGNNETSIINNFNKKNDDLYQASIGLSPKETSLVLGEMIVSRGTEKIPVNNSYNAYFYMKLKNAGIVGGQEQTIITAKLGEDLVNIAAYDMYSENPIIINSIYSYDNFYNYFSYTFVSYDSSTQTYYGIPMKVTIGPYKFLCYMGCSIDKSVYFYNIHKTWNLTDELLQKLTEVELVQKVSVYVNENPDEVAEISWNAPYFPNDDKAITTFRGYLPWPRKIVHVQTPHGQISGGGQWQVWDGELNPDGTYNASATTMAGISRSY